MLLSRTRSVERAPSRHVKPPSKLPPPGRRQTHSGDYEYGNASVGPESSENPLCNAGRALCYSPGRDLSNGTPPAMGN